MTFAYVLLFAMLAYSVFVALFPERFVRYQMWYYRKIFGSRIAEPGLGTFRLYRVVGVFGVAITSFAICRSILFA